MQHLGKILDVSNRALVDTSPAVPGGKVYMAPYYI